MARRTPNMAGFPPGSDEGHALIQGVLIGYHVYQGRNEPPDRLYWRVGKAVVASVVGVAVWEVFKRLSH